MPQPDVTTRDVPRPGPGSGAARVGRLLLLALLARWTWLFLAWPMRPDTIGGSFLHLIELPFHEAGHLIFAPFGELMTALGGGLAQFLVPVVCGIAFLTSRRDVFAATVMAWWAGENLCDIAVYADDARKLELVLLGGGTGAEVEGHDWERILTLTGALHRDHQVARVLHVTGGLIMAGALASAVALLVIDWRRTTR